MQRPLTPFLRFLLGHTLAYVPAFVWSAAWIPRAVASELESLPASSSEQTIARLMLSRMILPFVVAFALPHLMLLPWVLAEDAKRGRGLFLAGTALETLLGAAYGIWAWVGLLSG